MKILTKKFKLLLGFLATLFMSGTVLANDNISSTLSGVDLFTPSVNDKSIHYLGQLFGSVGNVLHGTSGQLFEKMFEVLNVGILVVAIMFFCFNICKWMFESSASGQFMSQKSNTVFMFIRSIIGIGILVPKVSGYSIIQVVVMWMVVQGVGLADKTWNTALDYLSSNEGTAYSTPAVITEPMLKQVNSVFVAEVCMFKAHQLAQAKQDLMLRADQGDAMPTGIQGRLSTTSNRIPQFTPELKDGVFYFPGSEEFNIDTARPDSSKYLCGAFRISKDNEAVTTAAFKNMYKALMPEAEQVAKWSTYEAEQRAKGVSDSDIEKEAQDQEKQVVSDIFGAAANYINGVASIANNPYTDDPLLGSVTRNNYDMVQALNAAIGNSKQEVYDQAKEEGWIMAGRYYQMVSRAQANAKQHFLDRFLPTETGQTWDEFAPGSDQHNLTQIGTDDNGNGRALFEDQPEQEALANAIARAQQYTKRAETLRQAREDIGGTHKEGQVFKDKARDMILTEPMLHMITAIHPVAGAAVGGTFGTLVNRIGNMMQGKDNNDPIIGLKKLGEDLLIFVSIVWLGGSIFSIVVGTAGAICAASNPVTFGFSLAYKWFIPLFMSVLGVLTAVGVVLYVYVPLIPFILFTFAAIGWFISVVEAMVAGPLVAFGMTHPEGHDLLGKAEQAAMLLLSIFLKPVLILIGLLGGMIFSRIALQLLNHGFAYVLQDIGVLGVGVGFGNFLKLCGVIVVYAFFAVAVVKQSFSLIYIIPEKVMRWIGLSPDHTQMPKEVMEGGQGMATSAGSHTTSFVGKGMEGTAQTGDSARDFKFRTQKGYDHNNNIQGESKE